MPLLTTTCRPAFRGLSRRLTVGWAVLRMLLMILFLLAAGVAGQAHAGDMLFSPPAQVASPPVQPPTLSPAQWLSPACEPLVALPPVSNRPRLAGRLNSPGYLRSPTRHGLVAPINPAVVSAHAPSWHHLPAPTELHGGAMHRRPHGSDCRTHEAHYSSNDFTPDPTGTALGWDASGDLAIYGSKTNICPDRPLCERPLAFYGNGPWPASFAFLGATNLVQPKFLVYGDFRTAYAQNRNNGNTQSFWNSRLNLELDLSLTSTERFHAFIGPLDSGQQFTGYRYENGNFTREEHYDGFDRNTDSLFFEGDLGQLLGGLRGIEAPFDLPVAAGLIPMVLQNGVWLEDSFVGVAATIPARNSPRLDWSNFDTTFFVGFDELTTSAFDANSADDANFIGFTTFIERRGGYFEAGWAYVEDELNSARSYHNFGLSYTRRYANLLSNSMRLIINQGQEGPRDLRTADGFLLLMENSFLTKNPYNFVPYANLFAGFGTPQPLGRLQGVLKNTGINFESDLLTGYPTLDDTANNTYGAAIGMDLLGRAFLQQLIVEFATVQTFDSDITRNASGDQYALGVRYQRTLNASYLWRSDAMYGWLEGAEDISGIRTELRHKF